VGSSAPAQDLGHSRSRIVIEPASVPEAAAKPALRHAGLYGARLVAWIPFLGNAPRACQGLRQDYFSPFGWRRQDQKDKAPKDGNGHQILLLGSIEANRRTSAKRLTTEARAFARLEGVPEGHACWQPFGTERCSKKGLMSAENVILLNIVMNKDLWK
jgi:hypothetical protein